MVEMPISAASGVSASFQERAPPPKACNQILPSYSITSPVAVTLVPSIGMSP